MATARAVQSPDPHRWCGSLEQIDHVVTTLVCVRGRYPFVVDRTVTYADNDHVSVTWAVTASGELDTLLALPSP